MNLHPEVAINSLPLNALTITSQIPIMIIDFGEELIKFFFHHFIESNRIGLALFPRVNVYAEYH